MWKSSPKQENHTVYLDNVINVLPGIGQQKKELFAAVGICTISDVIKLKQKPNFISSVIDDAFLKCIKTTED